MEKFGELLGWAAAGCYFVAVLDYFVKWFFKAYAARWPKDSPFSALYRMVMKWIVRYHRYFGMGAGVFALLHLGWQLLWVRVSYSGVLVTALLAATALLGVGIAYGHRRSLTRIHRPLAMLTLAVLLFHVLTKG